MFSCSALRIVPLRGKHEAAYIMNARRGLRAPKQGKAGKEEHTRVGVQ